MLLILQPWAGLILVFKEITAVFQVLSVSILNTSSRTKGTSDMVTTERHTLAMLSFTRWLVLTLQMEILLSMLTWIQCKNLLQNLGIALPLTLLYSFSDEWSYIPLGKDQGDYCNIHSVSYHDPSRDISLFNCLWSEKCLGHDNVGDCDFTQEQLLSGF